MAFKKQWSSNRKQGGLWTPADGVTYVWWDFADGDTLTLRDSSWIVQIVDKINNVVQEQTTNSKQYGLGTYNGLSIATCDGVDDQMGTVGTFNIPGSGYYQVLVIARPISVAGGVKMMISSGAAVGSTWRIDSNNTTQFDGRFRFTGGSSDLFYNQSNVTTWSLWGMRGIASERKAYYNGTETDDSNPVPEAGYGDVYVNFTADAAGFNRLNCELGEVLIFSSNEDRQVYEGYAAWKWNLESELPAGHPYKNSAPTT